MELKLLDWRYIFLNMVICIYIGCAPVDKEYLLVIFVKEDIVKRPVSGKMGLEVLHPSIQKLVIILAFAICNKKIFISYSNH